MATTKSTALVAAVAAVMIGLGVGAAQPPRTSPPPAVPLPMPGLPPPPPARAAAVEGVLDVSSVHRSSNFTVVAPTDVIARAVAAEAEFQRTELAKLWLGAPPPTWDPRCQIQVRIAADKPGGHTTFDFADRAGKSACVGSKMELSGTLEGVLSVSLPHEVTHAVLSYHFGRPMPRWAEEGIAVSCEPIEEQAQHDRKARELLNAGRGIRLKTLFTLKEYPRDAAVTFAQGHSVVRFLQAWTDQRFQKPWPKGAKALVVEFVQKGMDGNTADSWDKAAKDVYGFADVDDLEAQWLAWLATEKSMLGRPRMPGPPKSADPRLIPPTTLPGGAAGPPSPEAMFLNARKVKLPVARAGNQRGENVYLFVSRDKGAVWERWAVLAAAESEFTYDAPADGEYWFAVDVKARHRPEDLTPAIKVVVDTKPPEMLIGRGEKGLNWKMTDANLDPTSIKLQCKRSGSKEWQAVTDRTFNAADGYTWALKAGESLEARVTVKDRAGNETTSGVVKVE